MTPRRFFPLLYSAFFASFTTGLFHGDTVEVATGRAFWISFGFLALTNSVWIPYHLTRCEACRTKFSFLRKIPIFDKKIKSFSIGNKTYHPVPLSAPLLETLTEREFVAQSTPFYFFGQPLSEEDEKTRVQILYSRLEVLLVDDNGRNPTTEELELYVPVHEAFELHDKLVSPELRRRQVIELDH